MREPDAIYCTLTPTEQRTRRSEVRAAIVPLVKSVTSLANGLQLEFGASEGLRGLVGEFIELEHSCCSFLTFSLSQPNEELSLQIQGPPDAAHIIELFRRTAQGEDQ